MQILYGIQATGNGHMARALEVIPALQKLGNVDILVSGTASNLSLPWKVKYNFGGISLFYNEQGGVDYRRTWKKNNWKSFLRDVWSFPTSKYDVIITDFEPITAWASWVNGKDCIAIGHQASFRSPKSPRPLGRSWIGENILRNFAPAQHAIGFHFRKYDEFIEPPLIRTEIRNLQPTQGNTNVVYLPAFGKDKISRCLNKIKDEQWEVFHPSITRAERDKNIQWHPVSTEQFTKKLASCKSCVMSAGFEGPSEALYLKKKLLVIPISGQYEQACNAAALQKMGVPVHFELNSNKIESWLNTDFVDIPLEVSNNWMTKLVNQIEQIKKEEEMLRLNRKKVLRKHA